MRISYVPVAGVLSTDDDTLYTTPGGSTAHVIDFSIINRHSAAVVVQFWVEPPAGDPVYRVDVTLDAGHTLYPRTNFVLGPTYELHSGCDTADVVHYYLSIEEQTI